MDNAQNNSVTEHETVEVTSAVDSDGLMTIAFSGRLDSFSVGSIWNIALDYISQAKGKVVLDAAGVTYCDVSGAGLLLQLQFHLKQQDIHCQLVGLRQDFQKLLKMFQLEQFEQPLKDKPRMTNVAEQVGRATVSILDDLYEQVVFLGQTLHAFSKNIAHWRKTRWKDLVHVVETAGVEAFPIIALLGFLMGLILSFQSAIPMRQFGADKYVIDLVALSLMRELGPLMSAIILAGRTGSAFAAELGTMKINEEIDALTTMGLEPVRFLVINRIVGAVFVTPILTVFTNLFGMIGCFTVMRSLGYPMVQFIEQLQGAMTLTDLFGGLVKSVVFGMLVSGIGCLRGLQAKTGASAVGISTTRAVVSGIVLIVVTDGVFSIIYYFLGI